MKKLFIVFLSLLALVGCNPTNDTERPGAVKLNGDMIITLTVGDEFTDPGAYVENDSTVELTIEGTVNTDEAGTYNIKYSYVVNGVTISASRTVIVEEDQAQLVTCSLVGESEVDITVGDTYTDQGYTCDPADTTMTMTQNVVELVPGSYHVTYTYSDDSNNITLRRDVNVLPDYSVGTFSLSGDTTVTIEQYGTFDEPGFEATGVNYRVISSHEIDTNIVGTYYVTYVYYLYDQNNNTVRSEILVRTVEVVEKVFYEYNGYTLENEVLTVDVTEMESSLKYWGFTLELYQDDVLYDFATITTGSNSIEFSNITEGYNYKLKIKGDYYDDQYNPMVEFFLLEDFDVEISINTPTIQTSNEVTSSDTYSFDYLITDLDNNFLWFDVNVYDGMTLVDTKSTITTLNGSVSFDSLTDDKEYRVEVIVTYDEGTTNLTTKEVDETFSTDLDFSISSEVEHAHVYLNNENKLQLTVSNPKGYTIEGLTIDTVSVSYNEVDSTLLEIALDTTTLGEYSGTLDSITLNVRGESRTYVLNQDYTYEVTEQLAPENIPYVTSYFSNDDEYVTSSNGGGHTMQLELYNPLNLPISNIYLEGEYLLPSYIYTNTGTTLTFYSHFNTSEKVTGFSYEYAGEVIDVVVDSFNEEHIPYCDQGVIQVSTVQELKDMGQVTYGCYELMNDIDLSGENWWDVISGTAYTDITLFGNGYTISNVTINSTDIYTDNDYYFGLFQSVRSAHIEDLNINVNINIGNSKNGKVFMGGLAGYADGAWIENVTVSGTISSNWYTNGYVGGLIGYSRDASYEDITSTVNIDIEQHTPTIKSVISSLIAETESWNGTNEIYGYSVSGTVTITGFTSHANLYTGDPIAILNGTTLKETPGQ